MGNVNISLNQLKTLLNYQSNGTFATDAASTRGTLQLDANGKLQNVGRHRFSMSPAPASAQQNFQLRQAIIEAFSSNNAGETFMSDLRERLGLDGDRLSNGKTDRQGTLISTKPLERRELKEIITAFEKTRDKSFLGNFEEVDAGSIGQEKVQNDPYTRRIGELQQASEAFITGLQADLEACGYLPRQNAYSPTGGQKIAQLQFQQIKDEMNRLAQKVGAGTSSVSNALQTLAAFIDNSIGLGSTLAHKEPRNLMSARMTAVYKALDGFAKAMGVPGDSPFRDLMLSNFKANVKQAFINSNFSSKASEAAQKKALIAFANNIMSMAVDTQRLVNHDPRLPEDQHTRVHFMLHPDTDREDRTIFTELRTIVDNDLSRLMSNWEADSDTEDMITELCNECWDLKTERADVDQADFERSAAYKTKNKDLIYEVGVKTDRINEEYFKRTGALDILMAMGFWAKGN